MLPRRLMRTGRLLAVARSGWLLVSCSDTRSRTTEGTARLSQKLNLSPQVGDFVLYAQRSVSLAEHALVVGGDVGVRYVAAAGFSGPQAVVSGYAQIDAAHSLIAPSVLVGPHAQVGDVETNSLQNAGANAMGQVASFPRMPAVPLVMAPASFGPAVTVGTGETRTLAPGAYGDLTVADHGVLTLAAGAYSFSNVAIGEHCQVVGDATGVTIQVAGALSVASWSLVAPAASAPAGTLSIEVSGGGAGSQPAVRISAYDQATGLFAAPNGLVVVADHAQFVGALAGLDVAVGEHAQVTFQSGFPPPTASSEHGLQQLPGYVVPPMSTAPYAGPVPGSTVVHLAVSLPLNDVPALQAFVTAVSDRNSPSYRQYLTPAQFTAQFGPTSQSYGQLRSWAQSVGLGVDASFTDNFVLAVSGTAATVGRALYLTLNYYTRSDGSQFYAPDRDPSLNLGTPVMGIDGLSNYLVSQPAIQPDGSYLGDDFWNAYAQCSGLDGSGQTIAIVNNPRGNPANPARHFHQSDIQAYSAANNATFPSQLQETASNVVALSTDGVTTDPIDDEGTGEASLDIEMVTSMAPRAEVWAFEGQTLYSIFGAIANACNGLCELPRQISNSYGFCADATIQGYLMRFAAQGQSFFQATGDCGAFKLPSACIGGIPPSAVEIQALPTLTDVGGTTLTIAAGGGGSEGYQAEVGWSEGPGSGNPMNGCPVAVGSGGGWFESALSQIPSYQQQALIYQQKTSNTTNGASPQYRNIPDVAMAASNIEDYFHNLDMTTGTYGPQVLPTTGTSAAAPLWAGFMALANQKNENKTLPPNGFLNPVLCTIAENASYLLHDITQGLPTGTGTSGFAPGPGYDLVTGLGSPTCQLADELACATTCGGPLCVDLNMDPANCGACGAACQGGQCVAGHCLAVTVGAIGLAQGYAVCVNGVGFVPGDFVNVTISNVPVSGSPGSFGIQGSDGTLDGNGEFAYLDAAPYDTNCSTDQQDGASSASVYVVVSDSAAGEFYPPITMPSSYFCSQTGPALPQFGGATGLIVGSNGFVDCVAVDGTGYLSF